ncbi:hypothetical protein SAMD00019534_059180 [Acytostelium subglobosum LB1]|uniref:hypothetical protein n=1 Tax=Acytostelium subglobosum LB1 TaxID=1410327 RepID=UPI000644B67C|nr:hypothetical protein SAMD00019534_059180 [Acytostelium subglobosum LB1]GAM22743.1 hypothetical protein SAMD00019534_059180 [Acytostelium subglobosum LB1]|eukprot:XP_012753970.1 hypothetical protein SAMD00019534_059180 [Acytostelium subglobosum LB1]
MVSDPRKGKLKFSINDELIVVQWFVRDQAEPEDEFFLVPGELEFKKIKQCVDGRMYYLNFSTSDKKEFYWLQEENPDDDAKIEDAIRAIGLYNPNV